MLLGLILLADGAMRDADPGDETLGYVAIALIFAVVAFICWPQGSKD